MKIDWPRAVVVCVLALVVGTLQFFGKLPPSWAAGVGTLAVLLAHAVKTSVGDGL